MFSFLMVLSKLPKQNGTQTHNLIADEREDVSLPLDLNNAKKGSHGGLTYSSLLLQGEGRRSAPHGSPLTTSSS